MPPHNIAILVIDDDPFTLKLTTRMLSNLGYHAVVQFENAGSALQHLDGVTQMPELIMLDINMPDINSLEVLHRLGELNFKGSLFLLGDEDNHDLHILEKQALKRGINVIASLPKPVSAEKLASLMTNWAHSVAEQNRTKSYPANELRSAISNDEFIYFFQPKVEPATGKLVGVETLSRWQHPIDGLVLPRDFIKQAEAYGLMDELSRAVLRGTFAQARIWQTGGLQLQLAINISIDNLASTDFADFVARLAEENNLSPRNIVLEISESRIPMNDMRVPLETLTRLRMKRFRLSIDEFGTGHSSLVQLRDIPFDEIKIDRSFVHGAGSNKSVRAKYDACLAIAKQLDMEVVAVGVEDIDDWENLRHTGCHFAQGYFIGKPMPAAELPGWISAWDERVKN